MDLLYKTSTKNSLLVKSLSLEIVDDMSVSLSDEIDESLEFFKILSDRGYFLVHERYRGMQKVLNLSDDALFKSLPRKYVKDRLNCIAEQLELILEDIENREYLITYLCIKRFLRELSAPIVDTLILNKIAESTKHQATADKMMKFMPNQDGKVQKISYSMSGSSTGRLIVKSGPQILTTKTDVRKAFKSRFLRGKVLQIDISAAEPNIALNVLGRDCVGDIYDHIAKNILGGQVTRDEAKLITLCALYGQSPKNLKAQLPDNINPNIVIEKTRKFFGASDLERMLTLKQREKNLRNAVGRPIRLPDQDRRLLMSYFLQSSAAELSIVLFSEWCKVLPDSVVPLYVIHDALLIDCTEELSSDLLSKKIINLNLGDWSFVAKVSQVSQ